MRPTTDVPTTISPEAERLLDQRGLRPAFEQMLEHARRTIPGLTRFDVTVPPLYETDTEEQVLIEAYKPYPPQPYVYDGLAAEFSRWVVRTFPPDVYRYLPFDVAYEAPDDR
jgi:hypothetical protein